MATVVKPAIELAQVIEQFGSDFTQQYHPTIDQRRVLRDVSVCRTAALGGHTDQCDGCGKVRISYNSCRNRHCPKCQGTNRERWIEQRQAELLPVKYYHVVFTLPEQFNAYCLNDPVYFYHQLFTCSRDTLLAFARDIRFLGATPGMIGVLHTWGQTLSLHPHVHMIVTGGGVTENGNWRKTRAMGRYLFPQQAMSKVFRGKMMQAWLNWHKSKKYLPDHATRTLLYHKEWVVYAKLPFGGPKGVLEYLGRYTHKVAISNHRLQAIDGQGVTFTYKDYREGGKTKQMTLGGTEFLRRYCLHVLPSGFRKMRHYGLMASRNKPKLRYRQVLMGIEPKTKEKRNWKEIAHERMGFDPDQCPCCKTGKMIRIQSFSANAPPVLFPKPATHR